MAEIKSYNLTIEIPQGAEVKLEKNIAIIKGIKGEIKKIFTNPRIDVTKEGNTITIKTKQGTKAIQQDKTYVYTYQSHINNMLKGAMYGYTSKLKICAGHFPMQVTADANTVSIKNFLGEKVPRKAAIMPHVKVIVTGDIIQVTGADKEAVAQTAARIEQATRITNKDRRIFQDGCYIIEKAGEKNE